MSFIMVLIKVIPYLMPFVKEMLIGKKSWAKAFKENRSKTLLAIIVIASVILNVVLMFKVGTLAFSYLELSRVKQEIEQKYLALEKSRSVVSLAPLPTVSLPTVVSVPDKLETVPDLPSAKHKSQTSRTNRTAAIKAEFERMRKREANEH